MTGGGGRSYRKPSSSYQANVDLAKKSAESNSNDVNINNYLSSLLKIINDRDINLVTSRLKDIIEILADIISDKIESLYGGSVAKHTYVDGMSDIDTLLILNDTKLEFSNPGIALERLKNILQSKLLGYNSISAGKLALTIQYTDGMELQILPAIKTDAGIKIPSHTGTQWSEIDPAAFSEVLTRRNQQCGNKLIPTIKLIKAINSNMPEGYQMSGYHIESMAVQAFKGYNSSYALTDMIKHFYASATTQVLNPLKDKTGQSVHTDDYLGPANSQDRANYSAILSRISARISKADTLEKWETIFKGYLSE